MSISSISSPGLGSGLDVTSIVTALVNATIAPKQARHDQSLKAANAQISDIGKITSSLTDLQSSLSKLTRLSSLYSLQATTNDNSFFTASISSATTATKGSYQIEVKQLAQQQSLATHYISDTNHAGTGSININFGSYNADKSQFTINPKASPINITIPSGGDSLTAIKDAINSAGSSQVMANIVQDDTGARLTLTSKNTGESYAMQITGTLTELNYDPTANNAQLTEHVAAQNSLVKVNGLTLSQNSNELTNAVQGVSINLLKAQEGTVNTLTVGDDQTNLSNSIQDFVNKYNGTFALLNTLTNYNATTKTAGTYQADSEFRNLKFSLGSWMSKTNSDPSSPIHSLADLGITSDTNGILQLDKTKLETALTNNYKYIGGLFAKTASASDANISLQNLSPTVAAGNYNVNLTSYTPGVSMTGTIGGLSANSSNGTVLNGSGTLAGLSINVLGGSTGDRGTITVSDGLAVQLSNFLNSYTDNLTGQFALRKTQVNQQIKQLDKEQAAITMQQTQLTSNYMARYSALDTLMNQMSNTANFLTQQLAKL